MRTKTLLITAALAAAGITSSVAQTVYSVNAVGFVNVTVPAGQFKLVANPLNQPTNDLATVLPDAPANTAVYEFTPAGFAIYTKRGTAWTGTGAAEARLNPGEGFFIKNNGTADFRLTFIGEVPQGPALTTPIVSGFNLLASQVPQAGRVEADLGLPAQLNDVVYMLGAGGYVLHTKRAATWTPSEPSPGVAEGFFLRASSARNWTRSFSVNQ